MNHLMLLHIHKERLDRLDMIAVANEFISRFEKRKEIFGISPKKVKMHNNGIQKSVEQ